MRISFFDRICFIVSLNRRDRALSLSVKDCTLFGRIKRCSPLQFCIYFSYPFKVVFCLIDS